MNQRDFPDGRRGMHGQPIAAHVGCAPVFLFVFDFAADHGGFGIESFLADGRPVEIQVRIDPDDGPAGSHDGREESV